MSGVAKAALTALDRALEDRPDLVYEDLTKALRSIVCLRQELIAELPNGATGDSLERCNTILSLVVGSEYPLSGLHRDRMQQARRELSFLVEVRG